MVNEERNSGQGGSFLSSVLTSGRSERRKFISTIPGGKPSRNLREDTTELADQCTGGPETTSSVEEGRNLSRSSAVSSGETKQETVTVGEVSHAL